MFNILDVSVLVWCSIYSMCLCWSGRSIVIVRGVVVVVYLARRFYTRMPLVLVSYTALSTLDVLCFCVVPESSRPSLIDTCSSIVAATTS
jgi:hypothetical protein